MPEAIKTSKGFLVIKSTKKEIKMHFGKDVKCDFCNDSKSENGVFISVINSWYCKSCFQLWHSGTERYKQDLEVEIKNYHHVCSIIGINLN